MIRTEGQASDVDRLLVEFKSLLGEFVALLDRFGPCVVTSEGRR
jgi:hypothetical protein